MTEPLDHSLLRLPEKKIPLIRIVQELHITLVSPTPDDGFVFCVSIPDV